MGFLIQITDPDCYDLVSKFPTKADTATNINFLTTTTTDESSFLYIAYVLYLYSYFALSDSKRFHLLSFQIIIARTLVLGN